MHNGKQYNSYETLNLPRYLIQGAVTTQSMSSDKCAVRDFLIKIVILTIPDQLTMPKDNCSNIINVTK